jgi:hypothetical protein
MKMKDALQGLEKRMETKYSHIDGEMNAYLSLICRQGREMQSKLFGHLIQFHGMLKPNGNLNNDTFIGADKWNKMVTGMKSKWEEIRNKVLGAETPMMPEEVGEIIADAIESEKKGLKRRVLLSWILRHDDSGFVPYVVVPKISIKARETGIFELGEMSSEVNEAIERVRTICKSPLLKDPLMEAAAVQEVLSKIKDPMKRTIVLTMYLKNSRGRVDPLVKMLGVPKSLFDQIFDIKDSTGLHTPGGIPMGLGLFDLVE